MTEITSSSFVRQDLLTERPAPLKTTGFIGLMRTRLFNSPTNILLTILGALLLWFTIVPSVKFLMVDAVYTGRDRTAAAFSTVNSAAFTPTASATVVTTAVLNPGDFHSKRAANRRSWAR